MVWILDTDHASLFLAGNKAIVTAVDKHYKDVAITVVTVQELFNGWVGRLNRANASKFWAPCLVRVSDFLNKNK